MTGVPFHTDKPLVVFGGTGLLGSQLLFFACLQRFTPTIVIHSSSITRAEGVRDELEEAFPPLFNVITTDSVEEACSYGGYIFFSKSIRAEKQTREEMLLENAPYAQEVGIALATYRDKIERVVNVSNPSDLMGLIILVHSGLAPERVMSLSALDTTRLRRTLRRRLRLPHTLMPDVLTLGSHDTQMAPMLSFAKIEGKPLSAWGIEADEHGAIIQEVRRAGIGIYKSRGHTAYQSPALLSLEMLMADDIHPFLLPTARYHHSHRYPYSFAALPTIIDSSGCYHTPFSSDTKDLTLLDDAFSSIAFQRDVLIQRGYLPPTDTWQDELQKRQDLISLDN